MANKPIKITVRRGQRESGQIVSAVATSSSGRILGEVNLVVPLMPGYSIAERVGKDEDAAIVEAAKDLVKRIATAVETDPVQSQR